MGQSHERLIRIEATQIKGVSVEIYQQTGLLNMLKGLVFRGDESTALHLDHGKFHCTKIRANQRCKQVSSKPL